MKKILHLILGRFFIVALSIILQVVWLCVVMWQFSYQFTYANLFVRGIAIVVLDIFDSIVAYFRAFGLFLIWKGRPYETDQKKA